MAIKLGINGFGRIARLLLRDYFSRNDLADVEISAINYRNADIARMAYALKYDSVFGRFNGTVEACEDGLKINGTFIKVLTEEDPAKIDWASVGAEYIIESTGAYTKMEDCRKHLIGGGKKVILTAPGKDKDFPTFVMGVNNETYTSDLEVISNASCTTNCLAPLAKVVNDKFGIKEGLMTTIHASTSKQKTVDSKAKDWRVGRSVYNNIIPTTTGAAKAVGIVIPSLAGKLTGMSMRIPAPDVSLVDLTCTLEKPATYEEICAAVKEASETYMKGIIEYNDEAIVSGDIRGCTDTCVFDATAGIMLNETFVKLIAWYDNEFGYASKTLDLAVYAARKDAE
jgi:glyceraldehyde 3-phosphate dehydrogenase